jgi:hypothetical protein
VQQKVEEQDNNQLLKVGHLHNIVLLILQELFLPLENKELYENYI